MHLTIRLKIAGAKGSNFCISQQTSKISKSSERNKVAFVKFAKGQYFNNPSMRGKAREVSLLKNNIEHLNNSLWNLWQV